MSDSTGSSEIWAEIQKLFDQGRTEAAVKRFTDYFGPDANELQAAMDAIAKGRFVTPSTTGTHTESELTAIVEQVQQLVTSGQRNEAIELFKSTFNQDQEKAENAINEISSWNEIQIPPVSMQIPVLPSSVKKKNTGCVLIGVFFAVILAIGVAVLIITGAFVPHYYSTQSDILVPAINGQNPRIAGSFFDPSKDTRFIGLVDSVSGKMLWKSDPIENTIASLAASSDMVYAADGPHLMAFHTEDGSLAWHTEMSDTLRYGEVPMLATSGVVITMTTDQKVTAYDAASGSQAWSLQQSIYDSTLRLSGDSLLILDYLPESFDQSVFFLNPITGEQQDVLSPTCASNTSEYGMDSGTGIVLDREGNSIYFVFDEGCVQRFDLSTKQLVWNSFDVNTFSALYEGFSPLLSEKYLYFGNGGALVRIEKSSGDEKILLSNPDYKLEPLAISGDNLLVRAKKSRGTAQFELWGVSADSGTILWQRNLKNAEPIDPPDEMAGLIDDNDRGWSWHITDAGLVLLTFSGEPNQVVVETLNPADGTSLGKETLPLKSVSGDFYSIPSIISWQGSVVYMDVDGSFYSLDLATMKLKLVY